MDDFLHFFFGNTQRRLERNLFFKLAMGCLGLLCLAGFCVLAVGLWLVLQIPTP